MLITVGFAAGIAVASLPSARATPEARPATDLAHKRFHISIDEIKQRFVVADEFSGNYSKALTLSDGSSRTVELTPMMHKGKQVVELKDSGQLSYMGLNGTTTNGSLMIQLQDADTMLALAKSEGWFAD